MRTPSAMEGEPIQGVCLFHPVYDSEFHVPLYAVLSADKGSISE
jgi:hypothetical protein